VASIKSSSTEPQEILIRSDITPADTEAIVYFHSDYYARRYGFNHEFGEYVREPLNQLLERNSPRERIWLLDHGGQVKGCIALAMVSAEVSQLRWYYVDESLQGLGFGNQLISMLIRFAREQGYHQVILWTVSLLEEARKMYERHGFRLDEEITHEVWGRELTEQKFLLDLR
jgi:GNAT superfamily N-acetyltransferase